MPRQPRIVSRKPGRKTEDLSSIPAKQSLKTTKTFIRRDTGGVDLKTAMKEQLVKAGLPPDPLHVNFYTKVETRVLGSCKKRMFPRLDDAHDRYNKIGTIGATDLTLISSRIANLAPDAIIQVSFDGVEFKFNVSKMNPKNTKRFNNAFKQATVTITPSVKKKKSKKKS